MNGLVIVPPEQGDNHGSLSLLFQNPLSKEMRRQLEELREQFGPRVAILGPPNGLASDTAIAIGLYLRTPATTCRFLQPTVYWSNQGQAVQQEIARLENQADLLIVTADPEVTCVIASVYSHQVYGQQRLYSRLLPGELYVFDCRAKTLVRR